ncbi:hypothetical protein GOL82_16510 [Sinorhizobium medicae]|nr:hypothetical protein [Sinorhizobium medicae]
MFSVDVLQVGSVGDNVRTLKFLLKQCGLGEFLEENGQFDYVTKDAVLCFQRHEDIAPTGIVDDETMSRLIAASDQT